MKIGCPKEIKPQEFRVGMTPDAAREAIGHGHEVLVETNAGTGAGFSDSDYKAVGAKIIATADEVFAKADMIVKVKEPQAVERKMLREGQLLFTYLHIAPDPAQTTVAACRCWRRCPKSRAVWRRRSAPGRCKRPMAAAAC